MSSEQAVFVDGRLSFLSPDRSDRKPEGQTTVTLVLDGALGIAGYRDVASLTDDGLSTSVGHTPGGSAPLRQQPAIRSALLKGGRQQAIHRWFVWSRARPIDGSKFHAACCGCCAMLQDLLLSVAAHCALLGDWPPHHRRVTRLGAVPAGSPGNRMGLFWDSDGAELDA